MGFLGRSGPGKIHEVIVVSRILPCMSPRSNRKPALGQRSTSIKHVTSTSSKLEPRFSAKDAISILSRSRVVYKFSCTGCSACYLGETNLHLATRVREQLTSDKNSRIFQHIRGSETCRALCSENCFSILGTAFTSFQLKIKEALHIGWENPSLNKQVNHVN